MAKFAFPRELRLLTSSNFTSVFQRPQRAGTFHITILGCLNTLGRPRVGFVISKKYVKRAYERNRIKRLMRESFRLHQHDLFTMDFVVIFKKHVVDLNKNTLKKELEKLWLHYSR